MRATAWKLARESNEVKDRELCAFAGRILAVMGPLLRQSISFTDHLSPESAIQLTSPASQNLPPSAKGFEQCCIQILYQLSAYLLDEDEETISVAQHTLRQVNCAVLGP